MKVTLTGLLAAAGVILCSATLLGFAGRFGWLFELASHFRVQYWLGLALIALLLALQRSYVFAAVFTVFALINLALVAPFYIGAEHEAAESDPRDLRFFLFNLNARNDQHARVQTAIRSYEPHIVVLAEITPVWRQALRLLEQSYPFSVVEPREDNFGIALFSQLPLKKAEIVYIDNAPVPSVVAEVELGSAGFILFATHPVPPVSPSMARLRNRQIDAIGRFLKKRSKPAVLVGDLNITPWSYYFGRLLATAELQDSSRGRGIMPTWPAGLFLLRAPIDHFLFSEGVAVRRKQLGPELGSDHYPIIVDFYLTGR